MGNESETRKRIERLVRPELLSDYARVHQLFHERNPIPASSVANYMLEEYLLTEVEKALLLNIRIEHQSGSDNKPNHDW